MYPGNDPADDEGWEYGDVWKQGQPDQRMPEDDIQYAEILRGDTGKGYDDSFMLDLVMYLGSRGVSATYESFTIGLEPAAIKTYVLKVEMGRENEAIQFLSEKSSESE
jgi:hypothetical protein